MTRTRIAPVRCLHCGKDSDVRVKPEPATPPNEWDHPHRTGEQPPGLGAVDCPNCDFAGFLVERPADPHGHPEAPLELRPEGNG